jgi:hypothetical protein
VTVLNAAFASAADLAVVRAVVASAGLALARAFDARGKTRLDRNLSGYSRAAMLGPWFVLRDLDTGRCAPKLSGELLPRPAASLCFRLAVRAKEAWLLADAERMSSFLSVPLQTLPRDPDLLRDPKRTLVELARASSDRAIRDQVAPAPGTTARVGPAYTARIVEFAREQWRPEVAALSSESLDRCLKALRRLAQRRL